MAGIDGLLHALAVICAVTGALSLALFAIVVPAALIARWRYQRKNEGEGRW